MKLSKNYSKNTKEKYDKFSFLFFKFLFLIFIRFLIADCKILPSLQPEIPPRVIRKITARLLPECGNFSKTQFYRDKEQQKKVTSTGRSPNDRLFPSPNGGGH